MTACYRQKEKMSNFLTCDSSLSPGGRQTPGQKEISAKELEFCGNFLAFDVRA